MGLNDSGSRTHNIFNGPLDNRDKTIKFNFAQFCLFDVLFKIKKIVIETLISICKDKQNSIF